MMSVHPAFVFETLALCVVALCVVERARTVST
jgi:hypothetical protein